ncbi:MAG: cob(I)yrinic acid a,c-diamide adenosyltransferase [Fimbriimonadaceae bacterium]
MRIYTRTGDAGETGLIGGERVRKDAHVIQVVGELDELNACLGVALAAGLPAPVAQVLGEVQSRLFDIGAEIAAPIGHRFYQEADLNGAVEHFEAQMDALEVNLEPLRNFILPGGALSSAHLHHARTVARRAERAMVSLSQDQEVRSIIIRYLNRLSDYLFMAARYANHDQGIDDVPWTRAQPSVPVDPPENP